MFIGLYGECIHVVGVNANEYVFLAGFAWNLCVCVVCVCV